MGRGSLGPSEVPETVGSHDRGVTDFLGTSVYTLFIRG